jgi:hypothetical protein
LGFEICPPIVGQVCHLSFEIWDLIHYPCQSYHQWEDRTNKYLLYVAAVVGILNKWELYVSIGILDLLLGNYLSFAF